MELRRYWTIIRRYTWIVTLVPLVVLVVSLALTWRRPPPKLYQASVGLVVDVPPLPELPGMNFDPRYYAALSTQYLVDDFSRFVTGDVMAQAVTRRLVGQQIMVPPGAIQGSVSSEKIHRLITLRLTWDNPDQALAIMAAAVEALRDESPGYFARLGDQRPVVRVYDGPKVGPLAPSLRERLDLPLRVLLGLLAGVSLAFLMAYLDTRIYTAEDVVALGLSVLGEIPETSRRRTGFLRSAISLRSLPPHTEKPDHQFPP